MKVIQHNRQRIVSGYGASAAIKEVLAEKNIHKIFVVCTRSARTRFETDLLPHIGLPCVIFSDFSPNPLYEDVVKGIASLKENECDYVISIGGGSAIDVAKCICLFSELDDQVMYMNQEYKKAGIQHLCIPTTAGTGSESTRFAVCYLDGEKQSISHESCIPADVLLDPELLSTLPLYQKKVTVLDALCQAIESYWSVHSNEESKQYSKEAIELILKNFAEYLNGNKAASEAIMLGANLAGRAINITQTTAAHAMSYKITSYYKLPHGHAAAICLPHVWDYMKNNIDKCIDIRGKEYLKSALQEIESIMQVYNGVEDGPGIFRDILCWLDINPPKEAEHLDKDVLRTLARSVNPARLGNFPVLLKEDVLELLYENILAARDQVEFKIFAENGEYYLKNFT